MPIRLDQSFSQLIRVLDLDSFLMENSHACIQNIHSFFHLNLERRIYQFNEENVALIKYLSN